ncbi:hypothetical protein Ahy_B08g092596 [Arachis hypogaea]|uniref:Zinc finger GRF-type domain-containing protein n=1 Tax=Arachis hypogaea TaxID=3818 RepID=A0A444Y471_ARAHY|nr:hypothetical protein Ahy_B08g092596 [Arachis hypogaea]
MVMASASNVAGSSTNPRSFGSIMRRMNRNREALLRWSGTNSNPGRPFLGCPNYNTVGKKWCRLFLWVDKVLEEDVIVCDDRTRHSVDNKEWNMKIAWKFEMQIKVFDCMHTSVPGVLFNEMKIDRI